MAAIDVDDFEEVHRLEVGGTVAFLAIDYLREGRSFGGVRIAEYASEDDALADAFALARAMSRKLVLAGLRGGGFKTVIRAPIPDREAAVAKVGEFIQSLGGKVYCGADYGFTAADSTVLRKSTEHVVCEDLGVYTARTVFLALEAVCNPKVVAVQGLGAVGLPLAETLRSAGIRVIASELHPVAGFELVGPDEILSAPCDVFSPCAMGGVIDSERAGSLECQVVCGGANNPLASAEVADQLHEQGIIYVPDFISNVGASIKGVSDALGESDRVDARMRRVGDLAKEVVRRAEWDDISPHRVAVAMANEAIARQR